MADCTFLSDLRRRGVLTLLALLGPALLATARAETPAGVNFNRDVKPILSNRCFRCHGPDAAERKGGTDGLRLDTPEGVIADLGGYAAVVPGDPQASAMVKRVSSADADEMMPPEGQGKRLDAREIDILTRWIRGGARYEGHWSYVKPIRPELPPVSDSAWARTPVDRFLLARLDREGLKPSPEADRRVLIRRASLDITGLPPTPEEVEAFVLDADPQAYEKLVDRLLAKPAYGEHAAHAWLDLARYADSAGYADDPPRTIWLYRDYVIRSYNANKPFDRFTLEQIAGDLLPPAADPAAEEDQRVATAFHRNTQTNNEGGTNDEEFRNVAVVDRVNTTLAVWMGTTIACAQCHSHKYDPLSQQEYFRLFAIFNNSADADRGDESPLLSAYSPEQQRQRDAWQAELAALEQVAKTSSPELVSAQQQWEASFPLNLEWRALMPTKATAQSGQALAIEADGIVSAAAGAATDVYTVASSPPQSALRALRLEALPEALLPGGGPGHGGGNFVVTRLAAALQPAANQTFAARFVRIELPGPNQILSLAEVQVFAGGENRAPAGAASQSSTDYGGESRRAIDGNTNGDYAANSVSHTAASESPWWEVDLGSEQPLERIVLWNRTDGGVGNRLANFRVLALNAARQPVWQQGVPASPNPSTELTLSGPRSIEFQTAIADFTQAGFNPVDVLAKVESKDKGWAIAGATGKPHELVAVPQSPISLEAGSELSVRIEQNSSYAQHTLGRFRLSYSDDARAVELTRTPAAVVAALRVATAQRSAEQAEVIAAHYRSIAPELAATREKIAALQQQLKSLQPPTVPVMRELAAGERRVTKIQHRGNYLDQGDEVTPGVPAALGALPADVPADRLALARWLVDPNNPLTARVVANRYWEQYFGIGIVATSEEFGAQGDSPFHPELLDWLATELVRSGWDLKALVRLLVTSSAYRQSSRVSAELAERDPDNHLLARGPRFRLSAEVVRDQALAVGGLLSSKMYGPPVQPLQPALGLSAAFGGGVDWQTSDGEDRHRRGIYTRWRRSSPYPSMSTFDAPNREVCTLRRVRTNTPLQALVTLNDPVYVEAAQALGRRMQAAGADPAAGIALGFRLCLARDPSAVEADRLKQLQIEAAAHFATRPAEAQRLATEPIGPAPAGVEMASLAAWTAVANVLLNLDETLMKR